MSALFKLRIPSHSAFRVSNFLISAVFCYFVFPFWFKGLAAIMGAALYGICAVLICYHRKLLIGALKKNAFTKNFVLWLILSGMIIASIYCIAGLYKTGDINYLGFINSQFRALLRYLGAYLFACQILKRNITSTEYQSYFINGVVLYVIATLILLIPAFRDKWSIIVFLTENNQLATESASYYTRFGLQGFSGFMHTCLCDLAIAFCLSKNKIKRWDIYKICLLIIGTVCYGRIGLIGAVALIGFYTIKRFSNKITLKAIIIVIAIIGIIVGGFFYLYFIYQDELWFRWAFEPVINVFEGNYTGSQSSDRLQEMWFCPSIETIFLGDGYYMERFENAYYMHTDVGTLRKLLFGGIGFLLLIYVTDLIPVLSQLKRKRNSTFLICCSLFLIAMFEYKGEASIYISCVFFPMLFTNDFKADCKSMNSLR